MKEDISKRKKELSDAILAIDPKIKTDSVSEKRFTLVFNREGEDENPELSIVICGGYGSSGDRYHVSINSVPSDEKYRIFTQHPVGYDEITDRVGLFLRQVEVIQNE